MDTKWKLHSVMSFSEENELIYISPKEFLEGAKDAVIEEGNEDELKREIAQRKRMVESIMLLSDDGKIYSLTPIPEGVSEKEVEDAVKGGFLTLKEGMMLTRTYDYKEEDGELKVDSKITGNVLGTDISPWVNLFTEENLMEINGARFEKIEE